MRIYNYDGSSGEYLGASEARVDPLETARAGKDVFLIPANATAVSPPEADAGFRPRWTGSAWELVEDHRGVTVYSVVSGEPQVLDDLGPLPPDVTEDAPGRFQVWDGDAGAWTLDQDAAAGAVRSERNRRLTECDWTQVADSPLAEEEREAWAAYRQTLRDLPAQPGFPETINWPAEPAQEA